MTNEMCCYNCRFFSPGELGCPSYEHEQKLGEFDEANEGQCRRYTPRHGKTTKNLYGNEIVGFGEWPKVMTSDWCGEFEPRQSSCDGHTKMCACANCAKGNENRE